MILLNVNSYRPGLHDTDSDQAEPDASSSGVLRNGVDDETVNNESMYGKQLESDSVQIHVSPFSAAQYKLSNAVGKRSIVAGPSANRNKR